MQSICLHHFYYTTEMAWCKSGSQPTHLGYPWIGLWGTIFSSGGSAGQSLFRDSQHVVALYSCATNKMETC